MTSQVIDQLEIVHASHRIYNDLKLSNIIVEEDEFGKFYPILIDFGFATKFINENGSHIGFGLREDNLFKGNITFASSDQMEFKLTSRRDDLVSLCYLLFYVINGFSLPGNIIEFNQNKSEYFVAMY